MLLTGPSPLACCPVRQNALRPCTGIDKKNKKLHPSQQSNGASAEYPCQHDRISRRLEEREKRAAILFGKYPCPFDMSRKIRVTSGNKQIVCGKIWIGSQVNAQTSQTCFIARCGHVAHMDLTAFKLSQFFHG